MKVYIELTIIINLFQSYLILKSSSLILKDRGRFIFVACLISTVISILSPLYSLSAILKLLLIILTSIIVVLIAFKYRDIKSFLLRLGVLFMSTFLFGGGCFALRQLVGEFPLFIVSIIGLGVFAQLAIIEKILRRRNARKKFTYKLKFKDEGREIEEEGYLDSGNVLIDTITKRPIVLITYDVFKKFYKDISFFNAYTKTLEISSIKNGHYMKINSVGKGAEMLIFTVDELEIDGERQYKNVSLGLSFSGFEKSFGKGVLLNLEYM